MYVQAGGRRAWWRQHVSVEQLELKQLFVGAEAKMADLERATDAAPPPPPPMVLKLVVEDKVAEDKVVKKTEKKTKSLAPAPPPARECSALETRPGNYPQSDFKTGTYTQADLVMARRFEAVVSEDPVHEMKAEVDEKQADVDAATVAKEKAEKVDQAQLKTVFESLDADNNGYVSRKEWGEGLRENQDGLKKVFGVATLGEKQVDKQFKQLDESGSDSLTWNEMLAIRRPGGYPCCTKENVEEKKKRTELAAATKKLEAYMARPLPAKEMVPPLGDKVQTCKLSDGEASTSNWLGCSDARPDAGVLVAAPPTVKLGEKQSFGFVTVKFRFSPEQSAELGGADGIKTKLKKAFEQEDPKSCNKMVFTSPREKDKSVPVVTAWRFSRERFLQCPRTCALVRACIHASNEGDSNAHPWYSGHCASLSAQEDGQSKVPGQSEAVRPNEDELKIAYKWDVHVDVEELPEAEEVAVEGKDPETANSEDVDTLNESPTPTSKPKPTMARSRPTQRFWTEATLRVVVPGARYTDAAIPNLPAR